MDLVTFTDHDTIEGCLELLDREGPLENFFISEEVSTCDPRSGCKFHVSVFGIHEGQHEEVQRLRSDVRELAAYLSREGIPASLNHVGSSLVRRVHSLDELVEVVAAFPLIETRNGAQLPGSNAVAELLAQRLESDGRQLGRTGGSDAHTTRRIGWTWTKAKASDRETFLESLGAGRVESEGLSGSLAPMLRDVYQIVAQYYGDLVSNRHGHFAPGERRVPAACALVSLPLHLVALPATGILYRQVRVLGAAREFSRELVHASRQGSLAVPAEAEIA
jgi:predicted metal-dependent phosphoesterase TrpH